MKLTSPEHPFSSQYYQLAYCYQYIFHFKQMKVIFFKKKTKIDITVLLQIIKSIISFSKFICNSSATEKLAHVTQAVSLLGWHYLDSDRYWNY